MNKMREFQTFNPESTDESLSDTFQPKIFPSKMKKMREFKTLRFKTTDESCSNTFQPKIFPSK
jgi:hypothetical protein